MIDAQTSSRLFGWDSALAYPATRMILTGVGALVLLTPIAFLALQAAGKVDDRLRRDLWTRYWSWLVIVPLLVIPVLAGAAWFMLAMTGLSLLCYREYARATGLFRERLMSATVVLGILAVNFASLDHWYGLFAALAPLTICACAIAGILPDRPRGYIQRVALAVFGFVFFGAGLGHLSFIGNDEMYRPIVLYILLTVEMNDIFAYCVGKAAGSRRLCVNTSPNKTLGGALGALLLTTALATLVGRAVFAGSPMESWAHLVTLGFLISITGMLGDLMLSSIKRDIGVKDLGQTIPGHGGLLDRFDSLILVAPSVFHYLAYFRGVGEHEIERLFTR